MNRQRTPNALDGIWSEITLRQRIRLGSFIVKLWSGECARDPVEALEDLWEIGDRG